jgi:hypothetical protein
VNIDEINRKGVPVARMTGAHRNTETVQVHIDDQKQGVTAIAAVDANGGKLPLTATVKGKITRSLPGHQLALAVHMGVSESGLTTPDVMHEYFTFLRHELFPQGRLVVLLETCAEHQSNQVRQIAQV